MADISKVGIITPQGNKILNKLNTSLPITSISALADIELIDPYRLMNHEIDPSPSSFTGHLSAFSDLVDDFNDLLTKMRTADFMGTELSESGIITVEGVKIYNRLKDRFEVFSAQNHANLTGYEYDSVDPPQIINWEPVTTTEAYNDIADAIDYLNELLVKLREAGIIAE